MKLGVEGSRSLEHYTLQSNLTSINNSDIRWATRTPRETPISEMRERFRNDGYLLVKGLLPREDVLETRKKQVSNTYYLSLLINGASKDTSSTWSQRGC